MTEDPRKISLCITTRERWEWLLESFAQVQTDDRVNEIIIVDDNSNMKFIPKLQSLIHGKVKVFFNDINLGVYRNKHRSVQLASNEWVIVFDSDNIMTTAYVDKIYGLEWDSKTAYLPSFAKPAFDYRNLIGVYDKSNINNFLKSHLMDCMLNTMNYFINRDLYLSVYDGSTEPISADSIYINYLILKNNGRLQVVPGLEYDHRMHKESHYKLHQHKSTEILNRIMNKLRGLR